MADEAQKIKLGLEIFGLENVEELKKDFEELNEAAKESVAPMEAAIAELAKTGTVVEDLKEKIRQLKDRHEELNTARKAELISEEQYKAESDLLIKTLAEKETILKRLTAAETEKKRIDEEAAKALDKVTEALNRETAAQNAAVQAAHAAARDQSAAFASMTLAAEKATGFGEGEEGKGGFAGAAAGILKLERASVGLATGHGLRGATNALEALALALGGPAGVGLAIGGVVTFIDVILPKLQSLRDAMIGITESTKAAAKALPEQKEQAEKNEEAVRKLGEKLSPGEEEKAKLLKPMTEGKAADHLEYAITQSLAIQGEGAPTPQQVSGATAAATDVFGRVDKDALDKKLKAAADENRAAEANRLILAAPRSKKARDRLREIGEDHPDLFPPDFLEVLKDIEETPDQIAQAEADIEANDPDQQYMLRQQERRNQARIQGQAAREFNKAVEGTMRSDEAFNKHLETDRKHAETKAEHERKHAEAKAEHERKHAEQERAKFDRDNTPEALRHKREQDERNEIDRLLEAQRTSNATPEFMEHARSGAFSAEHLGANVPQSVGLGIEQAQHGAMSRPVEEVAVDALNRLPQTDGNAGQAIQQAIWAAFQRGQQLNQRDINRLQVFTESFVQ